MTPKVKRNAPLGEGPSISESYKVNKTVDGIVWTQRIEPAVIDYGPIVRGPPKYLPPHDTFLDYLEFRLNQKPTLIERIFGKRI